MSTWKYPVLAWEDAGGFVTAAAVEYPDVAAWGESVEDVMRQLREVVAWRLENEPWAVGVPDMRDPEIFTVKVMVRAEYRVDNALAPGWTHDVPPWIGAARRERRSERHRSDERDERVYPVDPPLPLRVVAVRGQQESGLWVCGLPMLALRFYAHERSKLNDLVSHYVREALARSTPRALARVLPSPRTWLENLVVRAPLRRAGASTPALPQLSAVAAAVGEKSFRRGLMRSFGRAAELERLRTRLEVERASVLIVGPSGVGKTSLLADAVNAIERHKTEDAARRRFWMTAAGRIIAGMRYLGQWQERCEDMVEELDAIGGVLCVERLIDLVAVGGRGPGDSVGAFLAPWIARGELRVVAEATPEELDACRRLLPGFVDLFSVVSLEPFPAAEEPRVLAAVAEALTQQARVPFADAVPVTVARLFRRFLPYAGFPGRAVGFMRTLAAERDGQPRALGDEVSGAEAVTRFSQETGLPALFLRDDLVMDEEEVRAAFTRQVIGQPEACEAAVRLVTTFKAGLHDPERPLGVLLFCGPTGVGKTELAKALARQFFGGDRDRLVRLDMSEYSGWGAADRLLGISGGEPGVLIRRLREQPFSVVLLDEIEKADAEIFDLLLGVFDEGRLKDAYGRVTTFRSAVIVMTSNLGADSAKSLGFTVRAEPSYEAEAMRFFRPEFFNRMDAVVRFGPLGHEEVRAIARKELEALARRDGLRAAGLTLDWTDAVVEHLAEAGFDSRYGARPLQRALEERVTAPLARLLAAHPDLRNCGLMLKMSRQGVDVDLA